MIANNPSCVVEKRPGPGEAVQGADEPYKGITGAILLPISATSETTPHVQEKGGHQQTISKALHGLWSYLRTPLGIIAGIYGLLVVIWGAALVIILAGWTPMSANTKDIWVEICSQVLNGLFTIPGIGLIPWRVRDAWHMSVITRYRRKAAKLYRRRQRADACKEQAIPTVFSSEEAEAVLADREMARLKRGEEKFTKSQSWYNPVETATSEVFPFGLALTITCLVVANSVFQCMLCGIMWGLTRHTRPPWATGCLIGLSFSCGIAAAGLIWWGSKRWRKSL